MCERTVTISLEEYEDLKARVDAEYSGYFERIDNYEGFNLIRKYKFYEEIPDPKNTYWGKEMIAQYNALLTPEPIVKIKEKIFYKDNEKLNKIPNWIRKIFKAL